LDPADETRRKGEAVLPDGTPFFGRLGEVAYDPDEDRVQCHLCGGWFRHVSSSHLYRTHGWSLAEYRDAFKLPMSVPLCARGPSTAWRAGAEARIGRNGFALGQSGKGTSKDRVRPLGWVGGSPAGLVVVRNVWVRVGGGRLLADLGWARLSALRTTDRCGGLERYKAPGPT
jgi:hypothetical protein